MKRLLVVLLSATSLSAADPDAQQPPPNDPLAKAKLPEWPKDARSSVPATKGKTYQTDPGTEGNGSFYLPPPYKLQPAEAGLIGNAVAGRLSGEKIYESKKNYPGWFFKYCVYVPAQYQKGKPAALMVFLDNDMYWNPKRAEFRAPTVFDNLIAAGEMPPTIALFIAPGSTDATGGQAPDLSRSEQYDTITNRYGKFLLEEIIPDVIQKNYDIVDDPNGWGIGGHSSGGIASFTVGWNFPDNFRKIQTNSGTFLDVAVVKNGHKIGGSVYPGIIRATDPIKPLRIALQTGNHDCRKVPAGDIAASNFLVANALAEKGYPFRFCWGDGYHYRDKAPEGLNHGPDQGAADFPNEMRWLWRGYKLPYYP
ncbi:MAG: alpha/beta hydrolase [Chthoniobacterales bacterium]